jgi:hypothetical protein
LTFNRPGFFAEDTSTAPTAAVRCAFRFICTYGGSMLRSVVMSFVLPSVFFGLHVATLLVTFNLSWGLCCANHRLFVASTVAKFREPSQFLRD